MNLTKYFLGDKVSLIEYMQGGLYVEKVEPDPVNL